MKKQHAALMLALTMALTAAGCRNTPPEDPTTVPTEATQATTVTVPPTEAETTAATAAPTDPLPTETAAGENLNRVRRQMEPSGAIAGVFYLGFYEGEPLTDDYYTMLDEKGYAQEYPFLLDIPAGRYIKTAGNEVYCIVPADPDSIMEITEWDETEGGVAGEVLYHSDSGEPVIVQGNVSDIMSNLSVIITDSLGNTLSQYHPHLSLEDGALGRSPEDQPLVLDLTIYHNDDVFFDLYVPNADGTAPESQRVHADVLDEYLVLQLLTEQRVLPDQVQIRGFQERENAVDLDLSADFKAYLDTLDASRETLIMQCLADSYLSAFDVDFITVTVEGETLETANCSYAEPLTFGPVG